jgi:hypothetical protein
VTNLELNAIYLLKKKNLPFSQFKKVLFALMDEDFLYFLIINLMFGIGIGIGEFNRAFCLGLCGIYKWVAYCHYTQGQKNTFKIASHSK